MFNLTFYYETIIDESLTEVWRFFQSTENLAQMTRVPKIAVLGDSNVYEGAKVHLRLNFLLLNFYWKGTISETVDGVYFIDEGERLPWPIRSWQHVHTFKALSHNQTQMIDRISVSSFLPSRIMTIGLTMMFSNREKYLHHYFN
jgi:ligand-binding SRPBCC domain-containing protein